MSSVRKEFYVISLIIIISCSGAPQKIICPSLKTDFEQYYAKESKDVYYWNENIDVLKDVFWRHDECIKTLTIDDLKMLFPKLQKRKYRESHINSFIVSNYDIFPGIDNRFITHVQFMIDSSTQVINDVQYEYVTVLKEQNYISH